MADNVSVIDEDSFMDLLMNGLIDRVDVLESEVKLLQGKFDVWQKLVESILGTAQTVLQYDSNLLTWIAIITAISIAVITLWVSKSKKEAIDEAVKKIDDSLEKGILPEGSGLRSKIIDTIIKSDEFRLAVEDIFDYPSEAKEVDDNRVNETQADKELKKSPDMK